VIENNTDETLKKICPICGKRVAGGKKSGSLTAYLFSASECSCAQAKAAPNAGQGSLSAQNYDENDFCPKCGLQIVTDAKDGSLTGFLFQSTRCKCAPDKDFADGKMSSRFWKLKQEGGGTVFLSSTGTEKSGVAAIELAAGTIIGGAYKIIELIGRGGMGEVYLARHQTLGKKCALKVIPPEQVTEMGWQRFQLEARAVAKLDHVNLVRVTDLGIHEGCLPFYAMDYVEGKNLAELIAEHGPMPLNTVLEVFMQVCDGIDCAHRSGILHRDLKPANIMLVGAKQTHSQAKVLDFGLAKLTTGDRAKQSLTAVGDIFGSPFYMSPEQCKGEKLDNRSDIYSLGCTMFECLTGRPPFAGHLSTAVIFGHLEADPPSLASVAGAKAFGASMEIVMAKLLRKNPVERYQTVAELRSDLERVARGEEVQPFYISRSKKIQGGDIASKKHKGEEARRGSNSNEGRRFGADTAGEAAPLKLGSLLVTGICSIVIVSTGIIVWVVISKVYAPPPATLRNTLYSQDDADIGLFYSADESQESAKAKAAFKSVESIVPHTLGSGKSRMTRFNFPTESMGTISWGTKETEKHEASGEVIVPYGVPLTLEISSKSGRYVWFYPEILEKIGEEVFSAIVLRNPPPGWTIKPAFVGLRLQLWTIVRRWKALKSTTFDTYAISNEALKCLDYQDSKIEELHLKRVLIDEGRLSRVYAIKRLKVMDFSGTKDIDPILQMLAGSKSLNSLCLHRTSESDEALKTLISCPNLATLDLSDTSIGDRELTIVSQITSLQSLNLQRCPYISETGLHNLVKLKKLRSLIIDGTPGTLRLSKDLPNCKISGTSPVNDDTPSRAEARKMIQNADLVFGDNSHSQPYGIEGEGVKVEGKDQSHTPSGAPSDQSTGHR